MEKETYKPEVYIRIDKVIFNTGNVYPSFDKYDERKFSITDKLMSEFFNKENTEDES